MAINFEELSHPGIRTLIPYKPGKSIEELAKEMGLTDIIKLASNENPLGCSPKALEAIAAMPSQRFATYPSPLNHNLIPKLAERLQIDRSQLFVSNGSDFIFGLLLHCFALNQKAHILTHDYAFSTYAIQANSFNIPVRTVPIHANWEVNIDNLIEACTNETRLIFIANPNNPTGLMISQDKIKHLLDSIPKTTLLVLDEAYYEFARSLYSCNSIEWLAKHSNLVITRTFSKIYGLAGLRLGYAVGHPDLVNILQRVQLPFSINQVALNAAYAALNDADFIALSLKNNAQGMKQLKEGLDRLHLNYIPSVCNFITFDCKEDGLRLYNYLLQQGIIIRPLHPYKMDNYLRVTIGTEKQNCRFLDALGKYYRK